MFSFMEQQQTNEHADYEQNSEKFGPKFIQKQL